MAKKTKSNPFHKILSVILLIIGLYMLVIDGVMRAGGPRTGGTSLDDYSLFSFVIGGVFTILGYILFRKSFKK